MSDETKTPQAGEYWFPKRGKPFLCIAANDRGDTVWKDWVDTYYLYGDDCMWKHWHHEPRCDSFDWVEQPAIDPGEGWELLPVGTMLQEGDEFESGGDWNKTCYPGTKSIQGWTYRRRKQTAEVWPKYYEALYQGHAYIKRLSEAKYIIVNTDGTEGMEFKWKSHIGDNRKQITEAEALARVKPAEQWPKYVIHSDQTCRWYIKRISETNCQYVSCSGEHDSDEWTGYSDHLVDSGTWREVTEAEALARVKPAEPAAAESPDDWVETTDPEYVLRAAIDEVWYSVENIGSEWQQVYPSAGMKLGDSQYEKARCRRRDLPAQPAPIDHERWFMWSDDRYPIAFVKRAGGKVFNLNVDGMFKTSDDWGASYEENLINGEMIEVTEESAKAYLKRPRRKIIDPPAPQPKRIPVRLFVSADVRWGDRYIVSVKDGNPNPERHQEIKFDRSGFYVEGE